MDTLASAALATADAQRLGALFDASLVPLLHTTFGEESDIDGNDRVIIFLTSTVNALVSAAECAVSGYVRGFSALHSAPEESMTRLQCFGRGSNPAGTSYVTNVIRIRLKVVTQTPDISLRRSIRPVTFSREDAMSGLSITLPFQGPMPDCETPADRGTGGRIWTQPAHVRIAATARAGSTHGCAVVRNVTDDRGRDWRVRQLWSENCHGLLFQCSVPGVRSEVRPIRAPLESLTDDELLTLLLPADD